MILQQVLTRSRRAAAVLDLLEAGSGIALALFLWVHMIFVATVIFGSGTFDGIARLLDETALSYVGIPPMIALFFLHFLLAARKIPFTWQEQRIAWSHAGRLRHKDTWTWIVQAVTGMAILLLASVHFWVVLTSWPIEAALSGYRVSQSSYLTFYLVLLVLGELHAGIGLYRLAVKWGWPPRHKAERFIEIVSAVMLLVGLAALVAFRRLGGQ